MKETLVTISVVVTSLIIGMNQSATAMPRPQSPQVITAKTAEMAQVDSNQSTQAVDNIPALIRHKPIFYQSQSTLPFSQAVQVGNTLYMSGQIGLKDGKLVSGGIKEETKQTLANINASLMQYGYNKSDLVKCMVMLTNLEGFSDFNAIYQNHLKPPYPVRSVFGVKNLAFGASVEIECMAIK